MGPKTQIPPIRSKLTACGIYNTHIPPSIHCRPTNASIKGYAAGMCEWQHLDLPPRMSQEATGILSYHLIGFPHLQCDPGRMILSPFGIRMIHTFRKLPIIQP